MSTVDDVAKHLHNLSDPLWRADTRTIGGIAWDTNYSSEYRAKMRAKARAMIKKFHIPVVA
jgi:hypothetical protein